MSDGDAKQETAFEESNDSHEERLLEGRRLTEKVDEFMQQGKPLQARSVLARNWQDSVPELPLRYPVVLESVSSRFARQLARFLRAGGEKPVLTLALTGSRVARGSVSVSGRRLGDLPQEQAAYLQGLGSSASVYEPRLTAIRLSSEGEVDGVEIEMVRPELRRCPNCDKLHGGEEALCEDCLSESSVRKAKAAESASAESEAPPLALHEAIDTVTVQEDDKPGS